MKNSENQEVTIDPIEHLTAESNILGFLSTLFMDKPSNILKKLSPNAKETLTSVFGDIEEIRKILKLLEDNKQLDIIDQEFETLFSIPGPKYNPPISAMYWDNRVKALQGPSTINAVEYYKKTKFNYLEYQNFVPDHISIELLFLSNICNSLSAALKNDDTILVMKVLSVARSFLDKHMLYWINKFQRKILQIKSITFYPNVIKITTDNIKSFSLFLEELNNLRESNAHLASSK
jgi:TorA maturation chaperone TorD